MRPWHPKRAMSDLPKKNPPAALNHFFPRQTSAQKSGHWTSFLEPVAVKFTGTRTVTVVLSEVEVAHSMVRWEVKDQKWCQHLRLHSEMTTTQITVPFPLAVTQPSKHAGSDLHPIWIGSEALARSRPDDSCNNKNWLASRLDPFGQNLTQSARTKLNPAWFCTVWSRPSVEEHNWIWNWEPGGRLVAFCQQQGLINFAHWLASGPDAFGQNLIRPSRSDLGLFCTIWSKPSLEKWNQIRYRKLDPANIQSGPIHAATWL